MKAAAAVVTAALMLMAVATAMTATVPALVPCPIRVPVRALTTTGAAASIDPGLAATWSIATLAAVEAVPAVAATVALRRTRTHSIRGWRRSAGLRRDRMEAAMLMAM